jgi:hypothetical protein
LKSPSTLKQKEKEKKEDKKTSENPPRLKRSEAIQQIEGRSTDTLLTPVQGRSLLIDARKGIKTQ